MHMSGVICYNEIVVCVSTFGGLLTNCGGLYPPVLFVLHYFKLILSQWFSFLTMIK